MAGTLGLIINGVDKSAYVSSGDATKDCQVTQVLGQRGTVTIDIRIAAGDSYLPQEGQTVQVKDAGTIIFSGVLFSMETTYPGVTGWQFITLSLVSLESRLDRHYVGPLYYDAQHCGFIFKNLFSRYAASEGITLDPSINDTDGPVIPSLVLDGSQRMTDVYDQLATTANFIWGIDPTSNTLYFKVRTATPAPRNMVSSDVFWESLDRVDSLQDYRNRQRIKLSFNAFTPENELLGPGDGTTQDWQLRKSIASVISCVETNSVQASVTGTFAGVPNDGDTITVDGIIYTWKNTLDNTQPFQIKIGASATACADNFYEAINDLEITAGDKGTNYSWPTYANWTCQIYGVPGSGGPFTLVFKVPGFGGNGKTVSASCANFSWSAGTLSGGNEFPLPGGGTSDVVLTVGINQVDTGKDAYYTPGDVFIDLGVPLPVGRYLSVAYRALGSDEIILQNDAAVTARAAIEGGTGLYENLQDSSSTSDPISGDAGAAIQAMQAMLSAYGTILTTLKLVTDNYPYLLVGDLLTLALSSPFSSLGLNGNWLIQEVDAEYLPQMAHFRYTITVMNVTRLDTWLAVWERFMAGNSGGSSLAVSSGGSGGGGGGGNQTYQQQYNLTSSSTLITPPLSFNAGDSLIIILAQNATGGRRVTLDSHLKDVGVNDLDVRASAKTKWTFTGSADGNWYLTAVIGTGTPAT